MIWFISDTHYSHKNIVRGVSDWADTSGCRDFDTVADHDDWLVTMINEKVQADDVLYHLGDWSFGGEKRVFDFAYQLMCQTIYIVPGNHDHHIERLAQASALPTSVKMLPKYHEKRLDGLQLVLSHYPIESWNNMERGAIHLHGHVHGQGSKIQGRYDVGVDALGLMSLNDVKLLPKATNQRHKTIEGGNKFASLR